MASTMWSIRRTRQFMGLLTKFTGQFKSILRNNHGEIQHADQGSLNCVCKGSNESPYDSASHGVAHQALQGSTIHYVTLNRLVSPLNHPVIAQFTGWFKCESRFLAFTVLFNRFLTLLRRLMIHL